MTEISSHRSVFRNRRIGIKSENTGCAQRFLCAVFVTVVKPISDRQLLTSGFCPLLFALSISAEAQQSGKIPRIGYLHFRAGPSVTDEAFFQALRDLGWIEGQNIAIE
jgi:hypothetical protein